MKTLSIGITTFRNRLEEVCEQVDSIRSYNKTIPILLAVTTNYNETMPEDYRLGILSLCAKHPNIYPLMFPGYTGLAKMWNNIIVHSTTSHIFIMNDDISFKNPMAINEIIIQIQQKDVFKINGTFGTFVISKKMADTMGYFDERLIAYGEEDGDFMNRYYAKYGTKIEVIFIEHLTNRVQNMFKHSYDNAMDCMIAGGGYKPIVNFKIVQKKENDNWPNEKQYPYEQFILDNYHNIGKFTEIKY